MAKHRLFIEDESSPQFSLNRSSSSEQKRQHKTSTREAKAGAAKIMTPAKKNIPKDQKQVSAFNKDAVARSPPTVKQKCVTTEADISTSKKDSDADSDSDSISMNEVSFFSSSNQKLPYSYEEDEEILKFIFKGQCIFRVSSILLWKHLEHKKRNPRRTYQSLKNRFLRNIKPNLFTTYRHLIPNEETAQKILTKFPELKKDIGRRETLTGIKLPERIPAAKISEGSVSSTIVQERGTELENPETTRRCSPNPVIKHSRTSSTSQLASNLDFHRKVELNGRSLTVLVNLNFEQPPPKLTRIYDRYWSLKLKNKLIPCSACGRCGDPEEYLESGAESDAFISNSVESKRSESPSKKKIMLRKYKSVQTQKRKKKNFISESCDSQRSCSPSLLNDVNDVDELDEITTKDVSSKSDAAQPAEVSNSAVLIKEADSTPGEPSSVANKDTDSIYQSTAAEFRKLIDSDEEEVLVKKCLIKNRKTIGFDVNLSVEDIHVDSYFVESNSPGLESATVSDSRTGCINSRNKTQVSSGKSLAQNMMNMLESTNRF